ncbi:MAG: futalosine hydrolase [Phycisphaerales bacterium]|nr:futalosine hydrolase [Phycisphaerales bacterium]
MTFLIITAVEAESQAIGELDDCLIFAAGIGRTNAAAATTQHCLEHGNISAVISAGIAGSLPASDLCIGDVLLADRCIYVEEGLASPDGFQNMETMGFSLGDFPGNEVPVDPTLLARVRGQFPTGAIATVATCSGTDQQAQMVVERTSAKAEAMEGAAVVHAARRLGLPALEIRGISNTTGDRNLQQWDLQAGLDAIGTAVESLISRLRP